MKSFDTLENWHEEFLKQVLLYLLYFSDFVTLGDLHDSLDALKLFQVLSQ